jgi:hypothetical protein
LAPERAGDVLGLAEEAIAPGTDVLQEELARRRRVQPHLPHRLRLREPGHPLVEHEAQDLPVLRIGTVVELADEDDRVGVRAVRDEGLVAVQDVAVAVATRRRLHAAERVGAGAGLGDRPGADLVERQEVEAPALLLRRRPLRHDRRRGEPDAHAERGDHPRAVAAELDDRDQLEADVVRRPSRGSSPSSPRTAARSRAIVRVEAHARHLVDAERLHHLRAGRRTAACRRARTPRAAA